MANSFMPGQIAVLYFTEGHEHHASVATAEAMVEELGKAAMIVPLDYHGWVDQIKTLDPTTFCLLASHGGIGENGTLQSYLELLAIPHSHSKATVSALLSDKHMTKLVYASLGIATPDWCCGQYASQASTWQSVDQLIEKPRFGGSKQGLRRLTSGRAGFENDLFIYERVVEGNLEVSVPVLYGDGDYRALAPIARTRTARLGELQPWGDSLSDDIIETCREHALRFSRAVGSGGVVKTDFVVDEFGKVWAIETDAIPGLSRSNATVLAAEQSGISYGQLLTYLINKGASK